MTARIARGLCLGLAVLLAGGCGNAGTPSPSSSASPSTAVSYDDFATGLCSAMQALLRAVGNPDTGAGSELSDALEQAASGRDPAAAAQSAAKIVSELETARGHAAYITTWPPAERVGQDLDRLLVAFEAWATAAVEEARGTPGADRQQAFEQAGGLDAWMGMLQGVQGVVAARPAGPPHVCDGVPMDL